LDGRTEELSGRARCERLPACKRWVARPIRSSGWFGPGRARSVANVPALPKPAPAATPTGDDRDEVSGIARRGPGTRGCDPAFPSRYGVNGGAVSAPRLPPRRLSGPNDNDKLLGPPARP